jgi:hypothetical protein
MSKLHEVLAVEGDLKGTHDKILQEGIATFTKKIDHFTGHHKTLQLFRDEDQGMETPDEFKELTTTVHDKLKYIFQPIVKYWDVCLQKETTNQQAKADLVVDNVTIGKDLPATFLLGMETKLKQLRMVVETIPTLQPGIKWTLDPDRGEHVYKAEHDEKKYKTAKTMRHKVLYEATDHHPAQIDKWEDTENVGLYITTRWSGMISPAEKSNILSRIDKLIRAVKKARQKANNVDVVKINVGKEMIDYIMG